MGKLTHRKDVRRQDILTIIHAGPLLEWLGPSGSPIIICAFLHNYLPFTCFSFPIYNMGYYKTPLIMSREVGTFFPWVVF